MGCVMINETTQLNHVQLDLVLNHLGTWLSHQIHTIRKAALSAISRIWRMRLRSTHAPTNMRQSQEQNLHFVDSHVLMPAARTHVPQVRRIPPSQSTHTFLYNAFTAPTSFIVATMNLQLNILSDYRIQFHFV